MNLRLEIQPIDNRCEISMSIQDNIIVPGSDTLQSVFEKGAQRYKDNCAFLCGEQSISYAELMKNARDFAAYLQHETSLNPGDRIAIQLPNCVAYPVLTWGALLAGLVVVNVNPLYTKNELEHIYHDSSAKALILLGDSLDLVSGILGDTAIEQVCCISDTERQSELLKVGVVNYQTALEQGRNHTFNPINCHPNSMALLQYTGGTTGRSKGAILTHNNLISAAHSFWNTTDIFTPGEEMFVAPLPLYHVYAFVAHIVVGVAYGVTSILIPNPRDINAFCNALENRPFSLFVGINTLFNALCQSEQFRQLDFSKLKFTLSGGMALDQSIAHRWAQVTGCDINEGYGLTESSAGVIINRGETCRRLGSVGKPMIGVEIRIVDKSGQPVPQGERGELHIKGPQIMQGYWQNTAATHAVLQDGWLATGDIAMLDEDGFVYIVDRIKDVIIVSGFNVYPAEIEQTVNRLSEVEECAAIGVASEQTGEAVQLFVVVNDSSITPDDIIAYCRENLAAYKVPKMVNIIDGLPKSPVGKVLKRMLKPQ